ncbi:phospholipase B1, membrane-associated-like isoform X1 [Acipenser ruthenus]|uniref:phospholipase B1, membrane-associated-like isoform X1 n=2 Tax=Acipenser ruthenus TaxID=7906 RepID=UPI0027416414|nr:phospholipase B1, membrane-associated-like isoform X1 [Acipenser ruthenus]
MKTAQSLATLVVLLGQLQGSLLKSPVNDFSKSDRVKIERPWGLPCSPGTPSLSSPASVHSLRPADIAVVAGIGDWEPQATFPGNVPTGNNETTRVLEGITEMLQIFNPAVTRLQIDSSLTPLAGLSSLPQQAQQLINSMRNSAEIDFERDWKFITVFVDLEELCSFCDSEEKPSLEKAVKRVEGAMEILHRQVPRALVSVVLPSTLAVSERRMRGGDSRGCGVCESELLGGADRLNEAFLTWALEGALQQRLVDNGSYSNREDFTVVLYPTPDALPQVGSVFDSSALDRMSRASRIALELWGSMLQPMRGQPDTEDSDDIIRIPCPMEDRPFLRTHRNTKRDSQAFTLQETSTAPSSTTKMSGSQLSCLDRKPSSSIPTSVHSLRPADVKVIGAVGDSLTAGNGIGSSPKDLLDVLTQYRGLSWSVGGDESLSTVTTLPNILRQFNTSLKGFSLGTGKVNSSNTFLNQAVSGSTTIDIPGQIRKLVDIMKSDQRINFQSDWKVVTLFIGGNDLCNSCIDKVLYSASNFQSRIRSGLDILHNEVPRVFVNLVETLHVVPLRKLHKETSLKCPTFLVNLLCGCVTKPRDNSVELNTLSDLNRAYQRVTRELVESGRYDTRDDFTVVLQPFFREVQIPLLPDGRPDSSYFTADCFHLSQKTQSQIARALWNNMLQPVGNKSTFQNLTTAVSLSCPTQADPFLRTYKNSNYSYPGPVPTQAPIKNFGSDLSCLDRAPSENIPTSVHKLRPADVKVVAALGDSITTGSGAQANNLLSLPTEWRGLSWSIGGNKNLDTVTTLPNILKQFNPSLIGFSMGTGKRNSGFNMAVGGAKAIDIPDQANRLVQALRDSQDVNFQNDWKLVTVFIGGNDLCNYCNDRETYSVENYMRYIQDSLDILYREVPRVFVNLVMVLQIEGLRRIKSNTLGCTLLQTNLCPCSLVPGEDSLELSELKKINREYQEVTERLVSSGRYDGRQDFTVVVQPFFRNSIIPLTIDGKPDLDFFSVDCFHFKERGQAEMSIELWNNMLEPVGQKHTFNNFTHDRSKLKCPSQERPYFFTQMNSFPDANPTAVSPPPPNVGPVDSVDTVPQWLAAVTAAVGLLVGAVLAGFLVSWKAKVSLKQKEKELEMKQTTF